MKEALLTEAQPRRGTEAQPRRSQPALAQTLLIETLDATPTLIAEGDSTRASRPLGNVLRGKLLSAVAEVVDRIRADGRPTEVSLPRGGAIVGAAVHGPDGSVLGIQVADSSTSLGTQRVAGWEFVVPRPGSPLRTTWTAQFEDLYGIEPNSRSPRPGSPKTGVGLADLYRRVPRPADVAVLMNGVADAKPGDQLDGQLIARHDDGSLRLIRYVRRVVQTSRGLAIRGIDHDITSSTTEGDLALRTLDAEISALIGRVAGVHCALVDSGSGFVIKWITEAPPSLDELARGGQVPIVGDRALAALRREPAVVAQIPTADKMLYLVRTFPCIGHGSTAAVLMVFSPIPAA